MKSFTLVGEALKVKNKWREATYVFLEIVSRPN